jgi:hypothetical protein
MYLRNAHQKLRRMLEGKLERKGYKAAQKSLSLAKSMLVVKLLVLYTVYMLMKNKSLKNLKIYLQNSYGFIWYLKLYLEKFY